MEKLWSSVVNGKPIVSCLWEDCQFEADHFSLLKPHLIDTHFQSSVDSGCFTCEVSNCVFETEDSVFFRRHLFFHVFHARLQYAAVSHIRDTKWTLATCQNKGQGGQIFYGGEPLICHWDGCETEYDDVDEFFLHVTNHGSTLDESDRNDKGFLTCLWQGCLQGFSKRASVKQHLRTHSGEKFASCPQCGTFFCSVTKFEDHIARQNTSLAVNEENSPSLRCQFCHKEFATQRLLTTHTRHHVFHIKCPHCPMTTETPSHMRKHIQQRHNDQKPFDCEQCDPKRWFKTMRELKVHHVSKHSGQVHECPKCDAKYKWKHQLTGHIRIEHTGGTKSKYACHLCSNTYTTGRTLGVHVMSIHDLKRPPGHTRFGFKRCADGLFRLNYGRLENGDLSVGVELEQRENENEEEFVSNSSVGSVNSVAGPSVSGANSSRNTTDVDTITAYRQQEGNRVSSVPGKLQSPRKRFSNSQGTSSSYRYILPATNEHHSSAQQEGVQTYNSQQTGFDKDGVLVYLDQFGLPTGPVAIVNPTLTYNIPFNTSMPGEQTFGAQYAQLNNGEMLTLIQEGTEIYANGQRIQVVEADMDDSGSDECF